MKPKAPPRIAPRYPELEPLNNLLRTPPSTTGDRLLHIQALGHRIEGYVEFMCAVENLRGSSVEAKQKAVAIFHDRLTILEPQLGHIPRKLHRRRRHLGAGSEPET